MSAIVPGIQSEHPYPELKEELVFEGSEAVYKGQDFLDITMNGSGDLTLGGKNNKIVSNGIGDVTVYGKYNDISSTGSGKVDLHGDCNKVMVRGLHATVIVIGDNNFVEIHGVASVRAVGERNEILHYNEQGVVYQRGADHENSEDHRNEEDNQEEEEESESEMVPARRESIKKLPTSRISMEEDQRKFECSICKEKFKQREKAITLPCFHRYVFCF